MKLNFLTNYRLSFIVSLTLHVTIFLLMSLTVATAAKEIVKMPSNSQPVAKSKPQKKLIKATVVKKELIDKAVARQKQQEKTALAKLRAQKQQLERAKRALADSKKAQDRIKQQLQQSKLQAKKLQNEILSKQKQKASIDKTLSDIQKKKDQQLADLEKQRQQQEAELLAAEKQKHQLWLDNEYRKLVLQIQRSVIENRNIVSAFSDELECHVQVKMLPDGSVTDVSVVKGSGNAAYDDNAVMAIYKASPFSMPSDQELVSRLRNIVLIFTKDVESA